MVDNDVDLEDFSDMDFTKGLNSKLQLVSYPILQPLFNLIQGQKVIYDIRKNCHFEHWISKSLINKILSLNNQNDTLITKERCYVHNIFTTNYKWLVVISSNLKLTVRLFFCPNNNNLPLRICCKNVVDISFLIAKTRPSNLKIKPYQVLTDNSHFFYNI